MKLVIAEKPSVARELARIFKATGRRDGYIEGTGYCFTWAFGHLVQLASPDAYGYNGWKIDNLPMLPERFKLSVRQEKTKSGFKPDEGVVKQLKIIGDLFEQASEIIVATDAGREGELIFRYIYHHLKCTKPFRRLWISSQTDEAIKQGFRNLQPGADYDNLFYSAQCRSESDWLVGLNATQALTIAAGHQSVLSLGRVQTPTLAMISFRYLENKNFVPETYFQVGIDLVKDSIKFKALSKESFKTRAAAEEVLKTVQDVKSGFEAGGLIQKVDIKPRVEPPPLLHDLGSLQQEANRRKGFTAEETLNLAQSLYEAKLITYPRTSSRYIGDDVFATIPGLLTGLKSHPSLGKHASFLLSTTLSKKSVNGNKVTDHHALLITTNRPSGLSANQQVVYEIIAGRLVEAFHKECIKEITRVLIESGALFTATGVVIKQAGWREVLGEKEEQKEEDANASLPKLVQGERLLITGKAVLEKQTKAKPLYNEASLLKAMETSGKDIEDDELRQAMKESGLGTPATRASIIETLLKRNYVTREKKTLVPTATGLAVYNLVKTNKIAQAELTGQWEKRLEEIRRGASVSEFKAEIRQYTREITGELLQAGKALKETLAATAHEGKPVCPMCKKGYIQFHEKAAGCSRYKEGCNFVVWRTIAGKKLTDTQIKTIIEKGKTPVLKGFKSKAGKPFEAALVYKDGEVVLDFAVRP